ncbi:MAG: histidine phosphatase family protein [Spirochaetes bacterium]|nr:histidine phosphatase family protein [Spirochaetota bacterium]
MSEIFMIRHGQASFGSGNYDVLSERGVRQSKLLASYCHDVGLSFDAVYTGTLQRQRRSAEVFIQFYNAKGITLPAPVILEGFDEYNSRKIIETQMVEMLADEPSLKEDLDRILTDRKSFQRIFERAMLRWVSGGHSYEGLESWERFQKRVSAALGSIMGQGEKKRLLVFASGGSISASVQHATQISNEETMQLCWQMVNSGITRFRYNSTRITLSSFNSYPHLELPRERELITYR